MGKVQYYTIGANGGYRPDGKPLFFPSEGPDVISLMLPAHLALLDPEAAVYVCGALGRGLKPLGDIDILVVSDIMEEADNELKAGDRAMTFVGIAPRLHFGICSPKVIDDTRPFRFTYFIGRKFAGGNPKTRIQFEASLKKKFGKFGPEKLLPAKKEMLGAKGERLELLAKLTYFLRKSGFEKFLSAPKTKELGGDEIFRIIRVAFFPDAEDRAKDYVKRLLADKKLSGYLAPIQQLQLKDIVEK